MAFSKPTLLGQTTVSPVGTFTQLVTLPSEIAAGAHTIQVEGTDSQGIEKALVLGVEASSTPSSGGTDLPFTGPLSSVILLLAASAAGFMGIFLRRRVA